MLSLPGFAIAIGLFLIWTFAYFSNWRTIAYLASIVPIITMLLVSFLPESPHWLMNNDTDESAYVSLQFFRNSDNDKLTEEINEIHQRKLEKLEVQEKSWKITVEKLTSTTFLKPFSCVGVLWSLNMLSGFPALTNYLVSIMKEAGSEINPMLGPTIIGILGLVVASMYTL